MKGSRPKTPMKSQNKENSESDPVEVFCRVRPSHSSVDSEVCVEVMDDRTLKLVPPENYTPIGRAPLKLTENKFTHVFCEFSTQREVFDRVAYDLVGDLIHGKNGLLFTYGITGSGKTYTMTGNPKESGILPRCLDVIFNSINEYQVGKSVFVPDGYNQMEVQSEGMAELERQRQALRPTGAGSSRAGATPGRRRDGGGDWDLVPRIPESSKIRGVDEDNGYAVFVSYVEIYNNYIYDLLDATYSDKKGPVSKILREDVDRNMYVNGVIEVEVKSTADAFDVFIQGQKNRKVAHTVLNTASSRSHSVFNIRLVQAPLDRTGQEIIQDKEKVHISQLSLVDLAGSERSSRTGNQGDRIRETGHINTSLMVLRQCIEQLRENQKSNVDKMVPYRDSRLTHLFKNYFDGEGKVRMVVCISPQASDYEENIHVMQFAELTQEVEVQRGSEVRYEGEGLTPGRRRAAKLHRDILETLNENTPLKDFPPPPTYSLFFDPMPSIEMKGPADDSPIVKLREYFEDRLKKRQEYTEVAQKKQESFESSLRHFVFNAEGKSRALEDIQKEMDLLISDNRTVHSENKQLQHKVSNLTLRLSKYETDARMQKNQEEVFKKKEREMAGQLRQREAKLRQVKEIFERGGAGVTGGAVASSSGNRNRFGGSQESLNSAGSKKEGKDGLSPSKKFGGSQDSITPSSRKQPPPVAPKSTTLSGSQATTTKYEMPPNGARQLPSRAKSTRRAPSPPPKPSRAPHFNPKYHRRSRSSGGLLIDHKSPKVVPSGTYFQPRLRHRKKTDQLEQGELEKAAEYVLRHQDYDPESGGLRTSLIKADVIPTEGGGSAVVFRDVEQVTHHSPTSSTPLKRKSGEDPEADISSSSKRGRKR